MSDVFANAGNLILTATFFHPLMPLSIPIAFLGFLLSYWVNKYNLLRVVERPDQMSGLLPIFFANLIPWIGFFWALSLSLFYRTLFTNNYKPENAHRREAALWATLGISVLFILLPIRTLINKYAKIRYNGVGAKWYDEMIT